MRDLVLVCLLATPAAAAADGIVEEVSAGTTLATATSPRSSWIANRLTGVWDVDDRFSVELDASVTRSVDYAETGTLSLSYAPDEHWSFTVIGGWIPASTSVSTTTLVIAETTDDVTLADAELSATSSSTSLAVTVGYDTAGDGDHETIVALTLGIDHYQSQQTFASIVDEHGQMVTTDIVRDYCASRMCSPEIEAALSPLWSQLSRFSINASVIRTEYGDTDLGLDATYYFYDQDPLLAGYYRLPGIGPSNLGTGVMIAPLHYAISPTLTNRWDDLHATLGLAYGSYRAAQGYEIGANAKVQYGVADSLQLYASFGTAWSVDAVNELMTSLSLALGGKYTW